jgi:hypothetical protein
MQAETSGGYGENLHRKERRERKEFDFSLRLLGSMQGNCLTAKDAENAEKIILAYS